MTKKDERWVYHQDAEVQSGGENVIRRVLAYCDDLMCVENTFEEGAEGIIDIIVSVKDNEDYLVPVMLVSCLDEDVELEGEVVQKQIDFLEDVDNITTAGRIILTNGNQMMYADWTGEEYDTEAALPTYEQMEKELFEMEKLVNEHNHNGCGCGCGID